MIFGRPTNLWLGLTSALSGALAATAIVLGAPAEQVVTASRVVLQTTRETLPHFPSFVKPQKRERALARKQSALGLGEGHAVRGVGWRMGHYIILEENS